MFVRGKPSQPSLMFEGKAGAYTNEATFKLMALPTNMTNMERPARDKNSRSL